LIIAFVGTPGSGKSYEAVLKITENLKRGRKVYTNIDGLDDPMRHELIRNYVGMDESVFAGLLNYIPKEDWSRFWEICEPGSLIVLDELQNVFRNRDWSSEKNVKFAQWASTHRHHGFDLILLTQYLDSVEKGARELVEWTYKFRKVNMFGKVIQKFTGTYFKMAFVGTDTTKDPMQKSVARYKREIFPLYASYVSKDVKELGIMAHGNVLMKPLFIIIPIIGVMFLLFASRSSLMGGGVMGAITGKDKAKTQKVASLPVNSHKLEERPKVEDVTGAMVSDSQTKGEVKKSEGWSKESQAAFQKSAPEPAKLDKPEQWWGATVYKDEDGKRHMFEGGKYVGWFKVEKGE